MTAGSSPKPPKYTKLKQQLYKGKNIMKKNTTHDKNASLTRQPRRVLLVSALWGAAMALFAGVVLGIVAGWFIHVDSYSQVQGQVLDNVKVTRSLQ